MPESSETQAYWYAKTISGAIWRIHEKGEFSSDAEKLVNYQKRCVFRMGLNLVKVSASLMMDTIFHGDFLENKILRFDKNLAVVS